MMIGIGLLTFKFVIVYLVSNMTHRCLIKGEVNAIAGLR
jgi:hypothetical protein